MMHNKTTWNENLFVGKLNYWYRWYLSEERAVDNNISPILYITTLREKYIKMYENLINQLKMYTNAIRVLSKGYSLISLLPPNEVKGKFKRN